MAGLNAKVFLVAACIVFAMTEHAVAGTCASSSCMVAKETVLLQLGAQKINGMVHRRPHGGPAPVPAIQPGLAPGPAPVPAPGPAPVPEVHRRPPVPAPVHRRPHGGPAPVPSSVHRRHHGGPARRPHGGPAPAPMALPEQEENEEKMETGEMVCCEGHNKQLRKVRKGKCVSYATKNRKEVPMKRCDKAMYVEIPNGASTCPSGYKAIHEVAKNTKACQSSLQKCRDADILACKKAGATFGKTWDDSWLMQEGRDDLPVGCYGKDGKVNLNTNTAGGTRDSPSDRAPASDISDYSVFCIQVSGAPPPPGVTMAFENKMCSDYKEMDFPDLATCIKKGSILCKGDYIYHEYGDDKEYCDCCVGTDLTYGAGNIYNVQKR